MPENQHYLTGRLTFNGQLYLYQIILQKKLMKLFDSVGRLRMSRHVSIPSDCRILSCEQYLIFYQPQSLSVLDLTTIGQSSIQTSQSHGIKQITHCIYNPQVNMFFVIDEQKTLYYILYSMSNVQVKKLHQCNEINTDITKMYVYKSIKGQVSSKGQQSLQNLDYPAVYLFEEADKRLVKYHINYTNDNIQQIQIIDNVYDIYYQNNWQVLVKLNENLRQPIRPSSQYEQIEMYKNLVIRILNPSQWIYTIDQSFIPLTIIQNNTQQLLILDQSRTKISCIFQKQIYHFQKNSKIFGSQAMKRMHQSDNFTFKIQKLSLYSIQIKIWVFDGFKSEFVMYSEKFQIDINKDFQNDSSKQQQRNLLQVHNNIAQIFRDNGEINPYFQNIVHQYLINHNFQRGDLHHREIGLIFFYTLFKYDPVTINKLASSFISQTNWKKIDHLNKQSKKQSEYLKKFLRWIFRIIDDVCTQIVQAYPQLSLEKHINEQRKSLQPEQTINLTDRLDQLLHFMRNLIKFIAIIKHSYDTQNLVTSQIQKIKNENYMIHSRFSEALQRAKSIYLTVQTLSNKRTILQGPICQQTLSWIEAINQNRHSTIQESLNINNKPYFISKMDKCLLGQINISILIHYMLFSDNYLKTAYIYLCLNPPSQNIDSLPLIPYLNEQSHRQILWFLYNCQPDKQKINYTITNQLPKIAAYILELPYPNNILYAKHVLCLSLFYDEKLTAIQILLSKFCQYWVQNSHKQSIKDDDSDPLTLNQQYSGDINLIISCFCYCRKIQEAYDFIKYLQNKVWADIAHQIKGIQISKLLKALINISIQIHKVPALIKLHTTQQDKQQIIRQLKLRFNQKDIEQIQAKTKYS